MRQLDPVIQMFYTCRKILLIDVEYRVSKVNEIRLHVISLKSCARCHGDMHVVQDVYGEYNECLQCGNTVELPNTSRYSDPRDRVADAGDKTN